jgi:ATP-binding cassette subfamily B protein
MEQGKVAENGTHDELFKLKVIYYKLIQKQKEALKIRGLD